MRAGAGEYGMGLAGVPIIESVGAVTRERVRVYPKRKTQSPRHWRRMDKKFLKRYGHSLKPAMFKMAGGIAGRDTFVVHPALMPQIRAALMARP
jgi:hypothetical protein